MNSLQNATSEAQFEKISCIFNRRPLISAKSLEKDIICYVKFYAILKPNGWFFFKYRDLALKLPVEQLQHAQQLLLYAILSILHRWCL